MPGVVRSARGCQELVCFQWIWIPDRTFIVQEMNLEGNGTMTGWDRHSLPSHYLSMILDRTHLLLMAAHAPIL